MQAYGSIDRFPRSGQHGAATLLVILVIVFAMALLTYTMTRTTVLENRITASDLRAKEAFHAAQAGLDFALQELKQDLDAPAAEVVIRLSDACEAGYRVRRVDDPILDLDASPTPVVPGAGAATFEILFGEVAPVCPIPADSAIALGEGGAIVIRSIGRSRDGEGVAVLENSIGTRLRFVGVPPAYSDRTPALPAPIIGRRTVVLDGGTSEIAPCATIAECLALNDRPGQQGVNISAADGVLVVAGEEVDYKDTGRPGRRLVDANMAEGADSGLLTENGTLLSGAEFFEKLIGVPKDVWWDENNAGVARTADNVIPPGDAILHIGDLKLNGGEYGTPTNPVTIVVDGNVKLAGNVVIWGVVYMTGSEFAAGTSKIFGSVIGENEIEMKGTGSVFFNTAFSTPADPEEVLERLNTEAGRDAFFLPDRWREISFN
jgi:hypothetical protein